MQTGNIVQYVGKRDCTRTKNNQHFFDDDIENDILVYCIYCGKLLNYNQVMISILKKRKGKKINPYAKNPMWMEFCIDCPLSTNTNGFYMGNCPACECHAVNDLHFQYEKYKQIKRLKIKGKKNGSL